MKRSVFAALLLVSACTGSIGDVGEVFPGGGEAPTTPRNFTVELATDEMPGPRRVSFAIPLSRGAVSDERFVRVFADGVQLPASRRGLARYSDGSLRSIEVQLEVDPTAHESLAIELGRPGEEGLARVPVEDTLVGTGSQTRPRVWVVLPTAVVAASQVTGPTVPHERVEGTELDAWAEHCNYDRWNTDIFLQEASNREVWLFDRVTAMYRGYAITGEASPLASAYREAALYREGLTISGAGMVTSIAVPGATSDLKYHYAQGVAIHYLLTGDDRYREAAEAMSAKVASLWDPHYDGSDEFWTERHAGFALLAHEWALRVTDDRVDEIAARADAAVDAYLDAQAAPRFGLADDAARCFVHTAAAHGEGWGGVGCSPWMSAILADALDAYARRVGGERAERVRAALVRLGRSIARDGRDDDGRPLYWMTPGREGRRDTSEEHWGESAYVLALAWAASGRTDAELAVAARELVEGMRAHGVVEHVRSFNWQCRSAVMAPALLY